MLGKYTVRPMDGMGYTLRISWDPAMEGALNLFFRRGVLVLKIARPLRGQDTQGRNQHLDTPRKINIFNIEPENDGLVQMIFLLHGVYSQVPC